MVRQYLRYFNVYRLHKRITNLIISGNARLVPSITRGYEPKRYLIAVGALFERLIVVSIDERKSPSTLFMLPSPVFVVSRRIFMFYQVASSAKQFYPSRVVGVSSG